MVKKTKLTVVTINFNNAAGLARTLKSVREQFNRNFEYVVVDGGSTDESVALISQNADLIDDWCSEKDRGEYDAMNKGIRMARGEYLMFLNSGDLFFDRHSADYLLSSDFDEDFVYGDVCIDLGHKKIFRTYPDKLGHWFLYSEMICHQVQIIRKKLLQRLGCYDIRVKIVADYDFMIHALVGQKASYRHIPYLLATYGWGGKSTQPAAAGIIQQGKDSIRKRYFEPEIYGVLQEFELTTYQEYQKVIQSSPYRAFKAIERISVLRYIMNAVIAAALWLRHSFSRSDKSAHR